MAIIKTGTATYAAFCDHCGASILNIFPQGDKIYGSECIKKMTGRQPIKSQIVMIEDWQQRVDKIAAAQALADSDPLDF